MTDKADPAQDSPKLIRAIGPWSLGANAVNMTVGGGIFALPALVAIQLGDAAVLAYLLCSALMLLVLLCLAEAGSRVVTSGGIYAYVETAFGPFFGFIASTFFWFGFCIASDAAIANLLVGGLASVWPFAAEPLVRATLLAALFALLATINVLGVRSGMRMVFVLTVLKLLPLIAIAAVGSLRGSLADAAPSAWPGIGVLAQGSLLLFFAFFGAETALTPSGEFRDPARTVPRGLIGAILLVLLLYLALQFASQGVLGTALAQNQDAPLAAVAGALWGPAGHALLLVCASVSILGTLSGDLLATPRALYAAAADGMLPAALARVHPRRHTPYVAIIAYAAFGYLLAISGAFAQLATLASASLLCIYSAAILATLKLRRDDVRQGGTPFVLPGGPTIPLLALAVILLLLVNTPWKELTEVALLAIVSSVWFAVRRRGGHIRETQAV